MFKLINRIEILIVDFVQCYSNKFIEWNAILGSPAKYLKVSTHEEVSWHQLSQSLSILLHFIAKWLSTGLVVSSHIVQWIQ